MYAICMYVIVCPVFLVLGFEKRDAMHSYAHSAAVLTDHSTQLQIPHRFWKGFTAMSILATREYTSPQDFSFKEGKRRNLQVLEVVS